MSARERLALDAVIFACFVIAANPLVTGMGLHEWIGILLTVPALLHLVINWDWIGRTLGGLLGKTRLAPKVNLVIDALLFVATVAVSISGGFVIPGFAEALGLSEATALWHVVHLWAAVLAVVLSVLHLAMHANWIAEALGKVAGAKA
jgi:hypothetical protein